MKEMPGLVASETPCILGSIITNDVINTREIRARNAISYAAFNREKALFWSGNGL
jgi:hypothetical protein